MNSSPISPRDSGAAASSRRWRDVILLGGLFMLVVGGLIGLAASTGWDETKEALTSLTFAQICLLLVLSLANYILRSARWHLFARRLGLATTFLQNTRHFLGGFAMTATPGRVGELVRMRWIRRETGWSFEKSAPLILVDRAADVSAMAILLALGLALSTAGMAGGMPVAVLALIAAFVVTRPALMRRVGDLAHRVSGRRFPKLFVMVRRAARSLDAFTGPGVLVLAGILGVVGWFAEGYAFHLLLVWMGAHIEMWMAVAIFVFATLAGGLTGAPGGLGGAEAAMLALLTLQNVPLEIAVPATLIIRVTTLWFAILIGLIVFPVAERQSTRSRDVVERS